MKPLTLLVAALVLTSMSYADKSRVMRLQTADDVGVTAAYYPSSLPQAPAVLLLHDFGKDRDEWGAFPLLLQHNDIAVLAIDFRGHGESIRRLTANGPQRMDYRQFAERDFPSMLLDINAAMDWLEEQSVIDKKRIAILGSGLGANLAVQYALEHDALAAMILFSPGLSYKDIRIDESFPKLRRMPLRLVASVEDSLAFESARRLLELRRQNGHARDFKELIGCTGSTHGAEQLKVVKELPAVLIRWLRQVLLNDETEEPAPLPPPPPSPTLTNAPPSQPTRYRHPNRPLP